MRKTIDYHSSNENLFGHLKGCCFCLPLLSIKQLKLSIRVGKIYFVLYDYYPTMKLEVCHPNSFLIYLTLNCNFCNIILYCCRYSCCTVYFIWAEALVFFQIGQKTWIASVDSHSSSNKPTLNKLVLKKLHLKYYNRRLFLAPRGIYIRLPSWKSPWIDFFFLFLLSKSFLIRCNILYKISYKTFNKRKKIRKVFFLTRS